MLDDIAQVSGLLVNSRRAVADTKCCRCQDQDGTSIFRIRRAGVDGKRSSGQLHSQKGMENVCRLLLTGLLPCILLYVMCTSSEAPTLLRWELVGESMLV